MEETLEAYAQLIKQGKVKAIGASNFSADRLSQALKQANSMDIPYIRAFRPYTICMTERTTKQTSNQYAENMDSA